MRRKKYQELARLAQLEARTRGHDLGAWTWGGMWTPGRSVSGRVTGSARCMDCKAEACIVSWPEPDETEIGGLAVAFDCATNRPQATRQPPCGRNIDAAIVAPCERVVGHLGPCRAYSLETGEVTP